MEQTTGKLNKYTVCWGPGEKYSFEGVSLIRSDKNATKDVWRGKFLEKAPADLKPDVEYCVKQIVVTRAEKEYPQKREYYDVVEFRGEHQRKILAKNASASEVENELRTTGLQNAPRTCYVVEPVYKSAREWFRRCWRYPAHERLDLIGQYALGCQELRKPENMLQGHKVDAHRDIKKDNGMICESECERRIVLLDYASVHLEKETDSWMKNKSDDGEGTYGGFLSPSNTAPEDLRHTQWKVCDTTDVYALGMMLASMFVHDRGEYFNLNKKWFELVNNENVSEDQKDRDMSEEFQRCWSHFDRNEEQEAAWVEKALWERDVRFRWEELPDEEVLRRIRRLFVRATRIDPRKRIDLDGFIRDVFEIREMARNSRKRFPLSVYLFEQTDFDRYGDAYARAAANAFREEEANSRALCVQYHHALSQNSRAEESVICQELLCRSEQEIMDLAGRIHKFNGNGPDMTVFAMYSAGQRMESLNWAYEFTGNIYMFCREVPMFDQIKAGKAGLLKVCKMLNDRWKKPTYIDAYTIHERKDDMEEALWYNPKRVPYQEQEHENIRQMKQGSDDPNLRPYGQMCVTMPDGSVFWI